MEKMNRSSPYDDASANRYAVSHMQQMSAQRMQQNSRRNNFSGRAHYLSDEQGHPHFSSREDGQRQWDTNAPNELNQLPSHAYLQGQEGNAAQSLPQGQMLDKKVDIQANNDPRFQSYEQDMEIGYEDKPSQSTFEGLEQKFLDEIMKLVKEHSEAEDAENARHRERIIEINTQYQAKLLALRAHHANRREEFLHEESQARRHQYHQQAGMYNHLTERGPSERGPTDPRRYGGGAATEGPRSYGTGQNDSYREQSQFLVGGRSQGSEARVPYPQGRVYNNAGARYY